MHIYPSREDFQKLATVNTVIPVWTEMLADVETPVAAYMKLVGDRPGFLLESVDHGERWSRYSFVGRDPLATLTLRNGSISLDGDLPRSVNTADGMLAAMESLLAVYKSPLFPELPPLQGGLMGFLGYDVVREVEQLPNVPRDDRNLPDAVMCMIGSLAAFDHWKQRVYLLESVPVFELTAAQIDAAYDEAIARIHRAVADLTKPLSYLPVEPPTEDDKKQQFVAPVNGSDYQRSVESAKEYIRAGDIFQVVLSQRFDIDLDAEPEHDRKLAAELRENPKEVAEHVMLVDLARNDVGRVAKFGSMNVDELMTLERYSHVMHMTSQVSGDIRDGLGPIDVLRATLPAGTVSGAPKVRAMEIIDELEPVKRGPYAGVVGYVDFSGNLDTAIAIRTMFIGAHGASLQAGAGIVADSIPEEEDLECFNKAAALFAAVPAARRMSAQRKVQQ